MAVILVVNQNLSVLHICLPPPVLLPYKSQMLHMFFWRFPQGRQKVEHLKAETQVKREHIHGKIERQKHERKIASAEQHYNTSLDIVEYSIEWALIALAEVETSILEAYEAKLYVEDLKLSYK